MNLVLKLRVAWFAWHFSMKLQKKNSIIKFNNGNPNNTPFTDDSPQEQKESAPSENPLEGYKVTSAKVQIMDQATNNQISECSVTGPNIADVAVTMY